MRLLGESPALRTGRPDCARRCPRPPTRRWTPRLSRRVTHVLVDSRAACQTQKLTEIQKDRAAWPQEVVDFAWLSDCQQANALLPCDTHRVLVSPDFAGCYIDSSLLTTASSLPRKVRQVTWRWALCALCCRSPPCRAGACQHQQTLHSPPLMTEHPPQVQLKAPPQSPQQQP